MHRGGGSWKKTEALAWNANTLTRAKTNVLTHARSWRGTRTDCPTSRCGVEIRFAMLFPVWRGAGPTRALNSKKMPPPNRARMAGGGVGHQVERRNSTHQLLYHRSFFCQLEKHAGGKGEKGKEGSHCFSLDILSLFSRLSSLSRKLPVSSPLCLIVYS
jgi:hypothetical protein